MAIQKFELELINSTMLSPYTIQLTLRRTDGVQFEFEPGQFITFLFDHPDGKVRRRSYSVANIQSETTDIEIAASYVTDGIATDKLFNMKVGEKYNAMGPAGRLILKEESIQRLILVGTGTGIAPYRAMLGVLEQKMQQHNIRVDIILGVQYREDAIYADDFLRYAGHYPNLNFTCCLSRQAKPLRDYECSGYVQQQFDQLDLNPDGDVVYLCGNPDMIDQSYQYLIDQGFSNKTIRREKYISSN